MTNTTKVQKWVYPFLGADGKEVPEAQAVFDALNRAEDGFYPIGVNGQWHGGVHFDQGTGGKLKQDTGVRCIADGEVVAYRIDAKYPQVDYPDGKKALYSTGFVLVKHQLEIPKAKATTPQGQPQGQGANTVAPPPQRDPSAAAQRLVAEEQAVIEGRPLPNSAGAAQGAAAPEGELLIFYSLYMHTLDWAGYQADAKRSRPKYWGDKYVVGAKAKDKEESLAPGQTGLRVRDAQHKPIAILPPGTQVTLGAAGLRKGYFALAEVVSGDTVPVGQRSGYVFREELDALAEPAALDSVFLLPAPKAVKAGEVLGQLGEYQRFVDANPLPPTPKRPLLQVEVFSSDDVPAFLSTSRAYGANLDAKQKTLLKIDEGAKLCLPSEPDQTLAADATVTQAKDSPKKGFWVKVQPTTKQIVDRSTLGAYDKSKKTYANGATLSRVVGDTDTDAISEDQFNKLNDAEQKSYSRREVLLPTGNPLWIERSALTTVIERKAWSRFPLDAKTTNGPEAGHLRVLPRAVLDKLIDVQQAQDDQGKRWWQVTIAQPEHTTAPGWVCEQGQTKVTWHSPWEWPGFDTLDEDAPPADWFKRRIEDLGGANADEAKDFKMTADKLDGGPLLDKLRAAIDTDKNQRLSADELKAALIAPWLAQRIGQLIVRYESEWAGPMAKWDALDPLMLEGIKDWQQEKTRIQKLQIWDKVSAEGFPTNPTVYHFHPVGLVANFAASCPEECKVEVYEMQTTAGIYIVSKGVFDFILETEAYREFPYVPGGASGVTIGYGYDLGQQSVAQIGQDLAGLYTTSEIELLKGKAGLSGEGARNSLTNVSAISISKENAMKLAIIMKKRYAQMVVDIYPKAVNLHPHCQGALLSLIINRGKELGDSPRRREMVQIKEDFEASQEGQIPTRFRGMKRLWENDPQTRGVAARREKEAVFFERGLKCDCWK